MDKVPQNPFTDSYFSLIALSPAAQQVVLSARNRHLLSHVTTEGSSQVTSGGQPTLSYGLNIGRHIPQKEHDLIATIGRCGDVAVEKVDISRLQCFFRINADTGAILFYNNADTKLFENNITDPQSVNDFQRTKHGRRVLITSTHRTVFGFGAQDGTEFQFGIVWHNDPWMSSSDNKLPRVRMPGTLSIPPQWNEVDGEEVFEKGWGPKLQMLLLRTLVETEDKAVAVSEAVDISNGKLLAVKTANFHKNPSGVRHMITKEVEALSKLAHPNIIQMLSARWVGEVFQIVTSLCTGDADSLKHEGREFHAGKNFYPIQGLFRNVVSALDYVHSKGIMHRDVKPENILYTSKSRDGNVVMYEFKLADFGSSSQVGRGDTVCGTPGYIAPEMYSEDEQSPKVDIWSLFATLLVFLDIKFATGVISNASEHSNPEAIRSRREYRMLHFIADMYDLQPDKRPTAAQLKQRLRSPNHKYELLASSSVPGLPASSRAFLDSSAGLTETPDHTEHSA